MTIELFQSALSRHLAGDLDTAAAGYRSLLRDEPDHAEAWHLLGDVLAQSGETTAALDAVTKAIALNAAYPEAHNTAGNLIMETGNLTDAARHFSQAVELAPQFAEAHANLGECRRRQGRPDGALRAGEIAIRLKPDLAIGHNNLGAVHKDSGEYKLAAAAFERALSLDDKLSIARINLADCCRLQGQLDAALSISARAVEDIPESAEAWNMLGAIKLDSDDISGAVAAIEKALLLDPRSADALCNMGNIQLRTGELDAAVSAYQRALEFNPSHLDAIVNLGTALQTGGFTRDAIAHYDAVLARQPNHVDARWNRALALLSEGDYKNGFEEYEARWELPNFKPRQFPGEAWDGRRLTGEKLLVWAEQGFGDAIQMARFIPLLADCGATVILECHPPLTALFTNIPGVSQCFNYGTAAPASDYNVPLMSLPHLLGIEPETLPAEVPYLFPPVDREPAAEIIQASGLKVGMIWRGRPSAKNFLGRPCPLTALAPLAEVPDVSLFSLQVGDAADEINQQRWGKNVLNLGDDFNDFADTAAAMAALDLIISIDTAAAHLSGALGLNTWTLLSPYADWRWSRGRQECAWYPTMRQFWRPPSANWGELALDVATALQEQAAALNRRS